MTTTDATSATHATSADSLGGTSRHQTPPPFSGAARRNARLPSTATDAGPAAIPAAPGSPSGHHSSSDPPGTSTTASARSDTDRTHVGPSGCRRPNSHFLTLTFASGTGSGAPGALDALGTSGFSVAFTALFGAWSLPSSHVSATHRRRPGLAASIHFERGVVFNSGAAWQAALAWKQPPYGPCLGLLPTFGCTPVGTESRSTASSVHSAAIEPHGAKEAWFTADPSARVLATTEFIANSVTPTRPSSSPLSSLLPSGDHSSQVTRAFACAFGICTMTFGDPPRRSTPGWNSTTLRTPFTYAMAHLSPLGDSLMSSIAGDTPRERDANADAGAFASCGGSSLSPLSDGCLGGETTVMKRRDPSGESASGPNGLAHPSSRVLAKT